jgi:hypothetical protein
MIDVCVSVCALTSIKPLHRQLPLQNPSVIGNEEQIECKPRTTCRLLRDIIRPKSVKAISHLHPHQNLRTFCCFPHTTFLAASSGGFLISHFFNSLWYSAYPRFSIPFVPFIIHIKVFAHVDATPSDVMGHLLHPLPATTLC